MSTAAKAVSDAKPAEAAKPKSPMLMVMVAALVSAGAAAGGVYFVTARQGGGSHAAADAHGSEGGSEHGGGDAHGGGGEKKSSATYQPLAPAFVVNLSDTDAPKLLQVEMEVMARKGSVTDLVTTHLPHIRNAVLMLLAQQNSATLQTREGKETLQKAVLAEIQKVLRDETGSPVVEAVYFTSFVVQ